MIRKEISIKLLGPFKQKKILLKFSDFDCYSTFAFFIQKIEQLVYVVK